MKIYIPIGDAEIVGSIKLKELELTNQQFFDVILTRYVSFTLPVSEEKKASHLRLSLYSDRKLTNLIKTIDTTNTEDREIVFGIDSNGFFNISENGFPSSYQGKPIFVDLQNYYHLTNFVCWQFKTNSWGEKFYSVFPSTNIDNYGNGIATSGGGGGFEYNGYFAVKDISTSSKDVVSISSGVVYLNNEKINVPYTEFELIDFLTGYVVDVGEYKNNYQLIDIFNFNNIEKISGELTSEKLDFLTGYVVDVGEYENNYQLIDIFNFNNIEKIRGELTLEKLDPSYVMGTSELNYPCELRLVISNFNNEIKTYYTASETKRTKYSTNVLIATIDKNDDGTLNIKQQCFGEIEKIL